MLLGLLAGFLASSLGWQINLVALQRGSFRGRTAAFLVGCGAVTADMVFLTIGFTGTRPLGEHPEWWGIIRWTGIAVLLTIAGRAFFVHSKASKQMIEVAKRNPTKNFLVGFLLVATNPAVFLMWLGILTLIQANFSQAAEPGFRGLFLSGFVLGAMAWFIPLTLIFMKRLRKWTESNHPFLSKLSAVTLVGVALFLIFYERF
ncbi:MAG: LysE family translocator [Candidatus Omnitrophica bacterium]|nr:LysE family translocator [Candidatus Omnitrophota bacterium]